MYKLKKYIQNSQICNRTTKLNTEKNQNENDFCKW